MSKKNIKHIKYNDENCDKKRLKIDVFSMTS